MKPTGVTSTSFRVWLATFIPSVAAAVTAFVQNSGGSKSAVLGGAGILSALFSTLGKLFHDHGVSIASIQQTAYDIAAQLPALKADLSTAVTFAENEAPALKGVIDSLGSRVAAVESGVLPAASTDVAAVTAIVHSILAGLAAPHAPIPVEDPPAA